MNRNQSRAFHIWSSHLRIKYVMGSDIVRIRATKILRFAIVLLCIHIIVQIHNFVYRTIIFVTVLTIVREVKMKHFALG